MSCGPGVSVSGEAAAHMLESNAHAQEERKQENNKMRMIHTGPLLLLLHGCDHRSFTAAARICAANIMRGSDN